MNLKAIKLNGNPNSADYMEYLIDSPSDISSLPVDIAPGSVAATASYDYIYRLNNNKTWVRVGE